MRDLIVVKRRLFTVSSITTARAGNVSIPTNLGTSGVLRIVAYLIVVMRGLFYIGGVFTS